MPSSLTFDCRRPFPDMFTELFLFCRSASFSGAFVACSKHKPPTRDGAFATHIAASTSLDTTVCRSLEACSRCARRATAAARVAARTAEPGRPEERLRVGVPVGSGKANSVRHCALCETYARSRTRSRTPSNQVSYRSATLGTATSQDSGCTGQRAFPSSQTIACR